MAAYAAAVDEVDQGIGRMLDYLHDAGMERNTLVIFLSDNGGDYSNGSITRDELQVPWQPKTNPSSSNGWASVKCTPFRYYKHACHEGGIATPLVIRWPAGVKQPAGKIIDAPASITDIYPTLIELAGIEYPRRSRAAKTQPTGSSLLPLLERNGSREATPVFQWYDFSRAWIQEEWKAVSLYGGPWQLFNLRDDRCEANDLAQQQPERLAEPRRKVARLCSGVGCSRCKSAGSRAAIRMGLASPPANVPVTDRLSPGNGATADSTTIELSMSFTQQIDFAGTAGKTISLYDVSDEATPIWQADPDETHDAQGKLTVSFDDVPRLLPNKHYAIRSDAGWIKVGGRPAGALNDGAYWWRFRTPNLPVSR